MYEPIEAWFKERFPKGPDDTDFVYRQTMLAKTCDTLRVLLPAGTRSNLGIYARGQSYEQLLMRLAAHPLAEMREYGELMLAELRTVIPEFLTRVDVARAGRRLVALLEGGARTDRELAAKLVGDVEPEARDEVTMVDHDPEGELKVAAAVLYAASRLPDDQLLDVRPRDDDRGASRDPARERRRAGEPAAQAGPGMGAHAATGSTCSATTARSATCSGTARSRSSGSGSPRELGYDVPWRSSRPGCAPIGTASWRARGGSTS